MFETINQIWAPVKILYMHLSSCYHRLSLSEGLSLSGVLCHYRFWGESLYSILCTSLTKNSCNTKVVFNNLFWPWQIYDYIYIYILLYICIYISPALQPNSERFLQGSRTVPFFRGVQKLVSPVPGPRDWNPTDSLLGIYQHNVYYYITTYKNMILYPLTKWHATPSMAIYLVTQNSHVVPSWTHKKHFNSGVWHFEGLIRLSNHTLFVWASEVMVSEAHSWCISVVAESEAWTFAASASDVFQL